MAPRILFVLNRADFFLSHRLPVAIAARDAGFEVHVATPPAPSVAKITAHGLSHHNVPMVRKSLAPWTEARTLLALWSLYRHVKPALVHHVSLKAVLHGTAAARLAGVPAIVNAVTGLGYMFSQPGVKGSVLRAAALSVLKPVLRDDRVWMIFQNPDDRAEFERASVNLPEHSVLIRGSGVEMAEYSAVSEPRGEPLVLFASRMLWEKGVGEFVEAAQMLRHRGIKARFVLAGETDNHNPRAVPEAQLKAWQDQGVVEWWGFRRDMPGVFAQSSVVVLPSTYREGVPKVLIEAAACARPIVTTNMPGCREIVRDGVNGILVPPRDPRAVSEAILRLLANPELRVTMGGMGRSLVRREFAVERVVEETLGLYARVLPMAEITPEAAGG